MGELTKLELILSFHNTEVSLNKFVLSDIFTMIITYLNAPFSLDV